MTSGVVALSAYLPTTSWRLLCIRRLKEILLNCVDFYVILKMSDMRDDRGMRVALISCMEMRQGWRPADEASHDAGPIGDHRRQRDGAQLDLAIVT